MLLPSIVCCRCQLYAAAVRLYVRPPRVRVCQQRLSISQAVVCGVWGCKPPHWGGGVASTSPTGPSQATLFVIQMPRQQRRHGRQLARAGMGLESWSIVVNNRRVVCKGS
jgi:hypothetical protein